MPTFSIKVSLSDYLNQGHLISFTSKIKINETFDMINYMRNILSLHLMSSAIFHVCIVFLINNITIVTK